MGFPNSSILPDWPESTPIKLGRGGTWLGCPSRNGSPGKSFRSLSALVREDGRGRGGVIVIINSGPLMALAKLGRMTFFHAFMDR